MSPLLYSIVVISSYAGGTTGILLVLLYNLHNENSEGIHILCKRSVLIIPALFLVSSVWISTILGDYSMSLMAMHFTCWTAKQFWDLVDSWSPEERAAVVDHYIVDEILFPLLLSLTLMVGVFYEAQRSSKGIASVALLLAALGGILDVVENQLHMSFLGANISTGMRWNMYSEGLQEVGNPPADAREFVTDKLVSIATTISISKYVCFTSVLLGLIINRCRSYMCSTAQDTDTVAEDNTKDNAEQKEDAVDNKKKQ